MEQEVKLLLFLLEMRFFVLSIAVEFAHTHKTHAHKHIQTHTHTHTHTHTLTQSPREKSLAPQQAQHLQFTLGHNYLCH